MSGFKFYFWIERYLFYPTLFDKILSIIFFPLTIIYCFIIFFKNKNRVFLNIPIVSIGNLLVGGTGKTPVTIELSKHFSKVAIILRGYNRNSKGLIIVSKWGKILTDVETSGDEAMLYAQNTKALVIVSKDRILAIKEAKKLGAKIIFLDDGFSQNIFKFDILLKPKKEPNNIFCLPSGPYREPKSNYSFYKTLTEDKDFKRIIAIKDKNNKIVNINNFDEYILITSISKPKRLLEFIDIKEYYFYPDHYNFTLEDIKLFKNKKLIITRKDEVKLRKFKLDYLILDLEINFLTNIIEEINNFTKSNIFVEK